MSHDPIVDVFQDLDFTIRDGRMQIAHLRIDESDGVHVHGSRSKRLRARPSLPSLELSGKVVSNSIEI